DLMRLYATVRKDAFTIEVSGAGLWDRLFHLPDRPAPPAGPTRGALLRQQIEPELDKPLHNVNAASRILHDLASDPQRRDQALQANERERQRLVDEALKLLDTLEPQLRPIPPKPAPQRGGAMWQGQGPA